MKLDEEVAQALTNLRANPDFSRFLKWVEEYKSKENEVCTEQEGTIQLRAQGAYAALKQILRSYDEAPQLVEKLKHQR